MHCKGWRKETYVEVTFPDPEHLYAGRGICFVCGLEVDIHVNRWNDQSVYGWHWFESHNWNFLAAQKALREHKARRKVIKKLGLSLGDR